LLPSLWRFSPWPRSLSFSRHQPLTRLCESAVAIGEGHTERAKQRMVRLARKFGGVQSTVMVPYPVQPGDTIYVLERMF
jgi:hypothetical protein